MDEKGSSPDNLPGKITVKEIMMQIRTIKDFTVSPDKLGFFLFALLTSVFFIVPDPEVTQKPFRVGIALLFMLVFANLLIYQQIRLRSLVPIIGAILLMGIMIVRGTIQTSFVNATLCLIGLIIFPLIKFELTENRRFNLNLLYFISMASIIVQFLSYSSTDGRPSMGYELNLSGAYLFLFFLLADILDRKDGKILVITLSFLLLSRLLIFCLLLFYLIRLTKKFIPPAMRRVRFYLIAFAGYLFISAFSVWYVATIKSRVSYDSGISRIATLNDGSNQLRFLANTLVMARIYTAPTSESTLFGFGAIDKYLSSTKGTSVMPHNELYDAIVQFGLITIFFFAFITLSIYNKLAHFLNLEFILPLLFYTMILWVRFFLVPSFEMIFIFFMLHMVNMKHSEAKYNPVPDANPLPAL